MESACIPDAFLYMYALETACQIQLLAQSAGTDLIEVGPAIVAGIAQQAEAVTRGLGGEIAWPGLLRKLDRIDPSYKQ